MIEFNFISLENIRESLSNFLMNHYTKDYEELKYYVHLPISQGLFDELKKRSLTTEELKQLISKNPQVMDKSVLEMIQKVWEDKESEILDGIKKLSNMSFGIEKIKCEINPYDNGGYYGEDHIVVGIYKNEQAILQVIAHELIHILYWRKIKELRLIESVLGQEKPWEWALSELIVYLIQKDKNLSRFWPDEEVKLYPESEKIFKIVGQFWKNKNFEEFLTKSYNLLRKENA